jgi:hypothetical protein
MFRLVVTDWSLSAGNFPGRVVRLRDSRGNISATILDGPDGFEIYTDSNRNFVCSIA